MRAAALQSASDTAPLRKPRRAGTQTASPSASYFETPSVNHGLVQRTVDCACGGGCPRCENRLPVQTKLAVSEPGDVYEQEADQLAAKVMRMPAPTLQRACAACSAGDAKCPSCEEENKELLVQRKPETQADGSMSVPDNFLQDLGHGQPLDLATRSFFEPRFGLDFTDVRVHTGARAAQSAAAMNALAYTVGQDVVFAGGQYAPHSESGKQLLAHELVHVLQGNAGKESTIRRQTPSTTTLTVPPNICNPDQTRTIIPAVATAQQWLRTADTRLTSYMGAMTAASSQPTALSMLRHFAASDASTVRYVQNKIRTIADRLRTDPGAPSPLTVECHGTTDTSCASAGAYVRQGSLLVFCPSFFDGSQTWQVNAMIHEIAHSLPPASGPLHITDRAYQRDRLYGRLSPGEALTNAESYALLVQELAVGPPGGGAVRDTYEDCPTDWRGALSTALARAEYWVHNAQNVLHDSRPAFMARWTTQANTFLGGQSAAQLAPATSAFDRINSRLRDRVDYECETEGGGRCDTYATYWWATGDFHICPSWRSLPTDDDRAQALLAGLFGYYDIEGDNTRRLNFARLARALTALFWAAPTAAEVSAALTADAAQPQPAPAPPPGPRPPF